MQRKLPLLLLSELASVFFFSCIAYFPMLCLLLYLELSYQVLHISQFMFRHECQVPIHIVMYRNLLERYLPENLLERNLPEKNLLERNLLERNLPERNLL